MPKQTSIKQPKWYAVHTHPGCEDAVFRYLKQRIKALEMEDKIFEVLVPKQKKAKIKRGKREIIEEKVYPGYVLVKMILDDNTWYIVRNTPRVTGFVGTNITHPTPLSEEEVEKWLKKEEPEFKIDYQPGETIQVTDGPFKGKEGKISEIDEKKGKLKVEIPLFGRETNVELDVLQVKKI